MIIYPIFNKNDSDVEAAGRSRLSTSGPLPELSPEAVMVREEAVNHTKFPRIEEQPLRDAREVAKRDIPLPTIATNTTVTFVSGPNRV